MSETLKEVLVRNVEQLNAMSTEELISNRHSRLMGYGTFISG